MSSADWTEILLFVACLLLISPLLGRYFYWVYTEQESFASKGLGWLERLLYRFGNIDAAEKMGWKQYLRAVLIFNGLGLLLLFVIQLFQERLPLNPEHFPGVPWLVALNSAASYVTNTDWQFFAGENTLSYFTQMAGLSVQNFLSAATGMAVFVALARGFISKNLTTIGNFWVDLVRSVVYILLPLSIVLALCLVSQGVVQTLNPYARVVTLEGEEQTIPMGPVASQVAIKQLGSNGGGFFHANSAHPFENPTRFSNFLEALSMMLISAALPFTFGFMVNAPRQGWLLFLVMLALWGASMLSARATESEINPILGPRSWYEGKEQRFGMTRSIMWFNTTTAVANGAINAQQGSLMPLSGAISLFNMMHGEIVFGGVGVGLCGMLIYCLLTSFFAGMLVGKSPNFLLKKIGKREMQWVMMAIWFPIAITLFGTALACFIPEAIEALSSRGPHAFSQLLYIFTSTTMNNGSAFAGVKMGTFFYNIVLSLTMIFGRLSIVMPTLALAGGLALKNIDPDSPKRLSTESTSYAIFLVCVILVVTLLSYLPSLLLGPVLEHISMMRGEVF